MAVDHERRSRKTEHNHFPSTEPRGAHRRDAEHRESLSATVRALRTEALRQTDTLARLQDRHAEAQRHVALHEAEQTAKFVEVKGPGDNLSENQKVRSYFL